jgi:hypothetical protein
VGSRHFRGETPCENVTEALVAGGRQIANQARSRGGFESNRLNERLSRQYRAFDEYLLPQPAWRELRETQPIPVAVETTCDTYLGVE